MAARRPHGTGSVYYDQSRGRWIGTYESGWTRRGTRRRRKVIANTERGARQKLRAAMRAAEQAEAPAAGGRPTVKRWADQWLDVTSHRVRPTTWMANRSAVQQWIIPTIGHKRLDALAPADMRAVTQAVLTAGLATSTASRTQAVLKKMLRDAIVEGHAVPQHALMVEAPPQSEPDRQNLSLPDALSILAVALDRPDKSRWVAALLQGMRPAECLGLTWEMVDLDAREVDVSWQLKPLPYLNPADHEAGFRVPVGYRARRLHGALHLVRPKTSHGRRVIPLVPWMVDALIEWRDVAPASPHHLVWPRGDGLPQTDRADRQAWADLCDAAQVAVVDEDNQGRRPRLYEARHTVATLLGAAGADTTTLTAIMGHASIRSTMAYLHTDRDRIRTALTGLADTLQLTTESMRQRP